MTAQCAECGHLHFLGPGEGYCECPIEGCECKGQEWAESDLSLRPRPGESAADVLARVEGAAKAGKGRFG